MVRVIDSQSATKMIKLTIKDCILKKNMLHEKLRARLTAYIKRALSFWRDLLVKMRAALTPIKINNIVQTTGKSQPGGESGGGVILS